MPKRVVILGGGPGGLGAASLLSRRGLEVTLVTQGYTTIFKPVLTYVATGYRSRSDAIVDLTRVAAGGVRLVSGVVEEIRPEERSVATSRGWIEYDYLVVALGAEPDYQAIPGLDRANATAWSLEGALRLRGLLDSVGRGASVVVGGISPPYPCPPAPIELAGLVKARRPDLRVKLVTFEEKLLGGLGWEVSEEATRLLGDVGVEVVEGFRASRVDTATRRVLSEDGGQVVYDVLSLVPPHKPPKPVSASSLSGPQGWMIVDPFKGFRHPRFDEVYGVGDVAVATLGAPMAGFLASYMASHAASRILEDSLGEALEPPKRARAMCFLDFISDGLVVFCDFTDVILGGGRPHCHITARGPLAGYFKRAFEEQWKSLF